MQKLGAFIQYHISRLHGHVVLSMLVVQDEQWPVMLHFLLIHVDYGRYNMRITCIRVHAQHRSFCVSAHTIDGGEFNVKSAADACVSMAVRCRKKYRAFAASGAASLFWFQKILKIRHESGWNCVEE